MNGLKCRYCRENVARADEFGLCYRCGRNRAAMLRYCQESTATDGNDGAQLVGACRLRGEVAEGPPAPALPTAARPGTTEKVGVMATRHAAGVRLWHPEDARYGNDLGAAI